DTPLTHRAGPRRGQPGGRRGPGPWSRYRWPGPHQAAVTVWPSWFILLPGQLAQAPAPRDHVNLLIVTLHRQAEHHQGQVAPVWLDHVLDAVIHRLPVGRG